MSLKSRRHSGTGMADGVSADAEGEFFYDFNVSMLRGYILYIDMGFLGIILQNCTKLHPPTNDPQITYFIAMQVFLHFFYNAFLTAIPI